MLNQKAIIDAFLDKNFYPIPPQKLEFIQTHISFIFIADQTVYKVKKAVNFGWVNFESLSLRQKFCFEECRLNARFSSDVYLNTVPISFIKNKYVLDNDQNVVEYAVKMVRLPQEGMLDNLLANDCLELKQLDQLALYLAQNHQQAAIASAQYGTYDRIYQNAAENFPDIARNTQGTITVQDLKTVADISLGLIQKKKKLLDDRRQRGYIKDLHGDLHTSHICFTANGPRLFDCIDFNPAFRCIDTAAEIAFLAMDLDSRGRADLSDYLLGQYIAATDDKEALLLITMYKIYYALVRCKVHSFVLADQTINDEQKRQATEKARKYFNLAFSYCLLEKPFLAITVGLMGSGKSTLSSLLCSQIPAVCLNSDTVRKYLGGYQKTDCLKTDFQSGLYSPEMTKQTYAKMNEIAKKYLQKGCSVLLDATFGQQSLREAARQTAICCDANFKIIELQTPDAVCLQYLEKRENGKSVSDGHTGLYFQQKGFFEQLKESSDHVIINQLPDYRALKEIISYLTRK